MNTTNIQNTPRRAITRANIHSARHLLEGGESLERILTLLENNASNAAIMHLTGHNKMIGPHREDFRVRAHDILLSRKG